MSKELVKVGDVSHYFSNIEVAVVELIDDLKIGDKIMIIQVEHEQVTEAVDGDSIGLQVRYRVRLGDQVFRLRS